MRRECLREKVMWCEMKTNRRTKAIVLGCYEDLEENDRKMGRKSKTVLYWKRMLNEYYVDGSDVENIV